MENKRKKVYDVLVKQTGYGDSYEEFDGLINESSNRRKVYDVLVKQTGYGDSYEEFDELMNEPSNTPTQQGVAEASKSEIQTPSAPSAPSAPRAPKPVDYSSVWSDAAPLSEESYVTTSQLQAAETPKTANATERPQAIVPNAEQVATPTSDALAEPVTDNRTQEQETLADTPKTETQKAETQEQQDDGIADYRSRFGTNEIGGDIDLAKSWESNGGKYDNAISQAVDRHYNHLAQIFPTGYTAEDIKSYMVQMVGQRDDDVVAEIANSGDADKMANYLMLTTLNVAPYFGDETMRAMLDGSMDKDMESEVLGTAVWINRYLNRYDSPNFPQAYRDMLQRTLRLAYDPGRYTKKDRDALVNQALGTIDVYATIMDQMDMEERQRVLGDNWEAKLFADPTSTEPGLLMAKAEGYITNKNTASMLDVKLDEANKVYEDYVSDHLDKVTSGSILSAVASTAGAASPTDMQMGIASNMQAIGSSAVNRLLVDWSELDKRGQTAFFAKAMLEEAKELKEDGTTSNVIEGFYNGFKNGILDPSSWDLGKDDLYRARAIKRCIDKLDKGETLTREEEMLIDALAVSMAVNATTDASMAYRVGKGTAMSIPYMLELLLTQGRSTVGRGLIKWAVKRYGKRKLKSGIGKVALGGVELLGGVGAAAVQTGKTGGNRVLAGATERMTPRYELGEGENGESTVVTTGEPGSSAGRALGESFYEQAKTYWVERAGGDILGEVFGGAKKGLSKLGERVGVKFKASDARTIWDDFVKKTGWHGTPAEYAEEVLDQILSTPVTEQTLDNDEQTGIFTVENQVTTALTCMVIGTMMNAPNAVAYKGESKRMELMRDSWSKQGEVLLGKNWGDIRAKIDGATANDLSAIVSEIVGNPHYSTDQKRVVLRYAGAMAQDQALINAEEQQEMTAKSERVIEAQQWVEAGYNEGYDATSAESRRAVAEQAQDAQRVAMEAIGLNEGTDLAQDLMARYGSKSINEISAKVANDESLQPQQKQAIYNYLASQKRIQGMQKRHADEVEMAERMSDAIVASNTNRQSGAIVKGTMKVDDRQVYVINGEVKTHDDGTIDEGASTQELVVRDVKTGEEEMISPQALIGVETYDAEEVRMAQAQALVSQVEQDYDNAFAPVEGNAPVLSPATQSPTAPTNADMGGLTVKAKIKGSDKEVYVVGGEVYVKSGAEQEANMDNSDESVVIVDTNGNKEMVSPSMLYGIELSREESAPDAEVAEQAPSTQVAEVAEESTERPMEIAPGVRVRMADGATGVATSFPEDGKVLVRAEDGKVHQYDELSVMADSSQPETTEPNGTTMSDGTNVSDGTNESTEVDDNGRPFIVSSNGTTTFGEITEDTGLPSAPIKLSVGYQDENGKGYGLAHIEANHGKQIRGAGFKSVEEFVKFVAENYDGNDIRVGNPRGDGNITYLIQVKDKYDNTLFIELSRDGSYWNVNSGGVFRKGYSDKKETVVKTEPQQPNNAVSPDSSLSEVGNEGISTTEPNGESPVSEGKDSENKSDMQEGGVNSPAIPVDEKGEPMYESAPVEATIADIYNDPDLDEDEADAFVQAKIDGATKRIAQLEKKKPKMGESKVAFKEAKAKWREQLEAEQASLAYWQGVQEARAKESTTSPLRGTPPISQGETRGELGSTPSSQGDTSPIAAQPGGELDANGGMGEMGEISTEAEGAIDGSNGSTMSAEDSGEGKKMSVEEARAKAKAEREAREKAREKAKAAGKRAEERARNRGDYRKAMAQWEDAPGSFYEYVAQALLAGDYKMRWNDVGTTRGLGRHTTGRRGRNRRGEVVTQKNEESKQWSWLIDDRGGMSPEKLAERLWNEYTGSYGEDMSEGSPLDVLLDVVTSMPTPQMMWDYVKGEHDARMEAEQGGYEEQYSAEEIEAFERDAMYREKYGVSEEEYWANEAQWDEFKESREMSAEELENYDNFVAEERIKEEHERRNQENAEDEQRTDNSESEGGVEVLSGTQPDITRGDEDVAGESEGVDGNGVESNDVAQEEAAELSEEDRQAIENMPIPTLKRQIKDTATTLFNVSQTSDQWQAENKDNIERAKLLLAYAKQELARKERLKKSNKWGIKIGNSATPFDVVRKMFEEFNSNEDLAQLFEKVAKVFETLPIKVVFSDTIGGKSTQGWFSPTTGTLKLPGYFVYGGGISEQNKAETILHEMIHAVTTYALYINEKPYLQTELGFRLSDDMHAAIRQLKRIYASIANDKDFKGEYGAVSVHEMIAELSNVQFREKLKKKGLWETIVDAIKQLFGITPSNALEGAEAALEYMLNNFDRSQWEKMAGMGEKRGKQMRIGVDKMGSSFEYFTGSLTDLISIAKNAVKGLFKKNITPASSRLVGDLKELGIDISEEYKHVVDNYAIRHTFNNHGGKGESLRGQIPINNSDFELIPDIVNNYDNITTIVTRKGLPGILYEKTFEDGTTVYVEEIHNKHKELTLVSMRKIKRPTLLGANRTNEPTPIPSSGKSSASKGSDNIGDVQGLEDYSAEELKEIAREYIEDVIAESGFDAEVVDLAIYGSRRRGDAREDSDLDIVVEYSGNAREDDLFNALNDAETQLEIDGVKVDINPITKSKSGTLGEFMERAREYDEGNESNGSTKESQPLTNPSAFGTSPKTGEESGGSLEDDGLLFRDGEVTTSPLGSGGEVGTTAEASTVGYSDAEVSMANDPIAKVMGKSQRSKKQQAKFAERERKAMRNRVAELAGKMHLDNVEVVESSQSTPSPLRGTPPKQGSGGELDNPNKTSKTTMSERKARAKGWFDTRTGKIVINISNHTSVADVERTLLHEAVAHYGLRQLFGKQFDTFLDNVYLHADAEVRAQIIELAKKHGWDFRTATEEYLAGLAEDTNFEYLEHNWSWWQKIKQLFMDMLESIGWRYQGPELSDNELRYLLWRSYENMVNPGRHRSILGMAEDAVRRAKFGIGEYSVDSSAPSQVAEPKLTIGSIDLGKIKATRNGRKVIATTRSGHNQIFKSVHKYAMEKFGAENVEYEKAESGSIYMTVDLPNGHDVEIRFASHTPSGYSAGEIETNAETKGINWSAINGRVGANVDISFNTMTSGDLQAFLDLMNEYAETGFPQEVVEELQSYRAKPNEVSEALGISVDTLAEGGEMYSDGVGEIRDEAGVASYDEKYGTELGDWLKFVVSGEIDKNKTQFHIAKSGAVLNKYGIKGNINVSRKAINPKRHTQNADHGLGVQEWIDVVDTINDPLAITRYNGKPNSYRIYTMAKVNGKNICVGVDVNTSNGVEITKISTAFGRDIAKIAQSSTEEELYNKEKATKQISGSDNSHLYAEQPSEGKGTINLRNAHELGEKIAAAESEVNTNPTDKQKEAGNYKKGHVKVGSFNITIEQPQGSVRRGVDADGNKWETEMQNTYGYIRGTEGVDGDHIDVFLSDDIDGWNGRQVYVVDQRNADGSFDEHKVMLGFNDLNEAEAAYMSNYEEGWQGLGAITGVSIEEFEKWIASSHRKTKAFAEYKSVKTTEGQSTDEGILFRDGESDGTREEYNRRVRRPNRSGSVGKWDNLGWRMKEAYQDSMLSLKELQDVIAKKYGLKEIPSWMNAYLQENLMSSRNKAASDVYMRDFYNPMMKEVQALIKKGVKYEDLVNYMIAKHGLERNVVMAERDAKRAADEAKEKGEDWQKAYDEALKENRKRDYSGLTALTGEESVVTAEKEAEKLVEEFEGTHETDALWEKVNAATKETLRKSYEGGLMSQESYESTEAMYEHYIPLRGWDSDIASDMYEYLMSDRPLLSPALKTAKGRTSLADDPIATIGMMADSTIAQANRNKMKQAFYYFAVNNPSDVVTISKQWYVYDEATKKWQPRSADIPLDASSEEISAIVEEFEARMEELARDGKAKRKSQGLDLDLRTVGREGEEHTVRVKVNGEEYCIYVNGSPRAAQALNGLTNPEMFNDALMKGTKIVNNYLAQVFTSKNPEFVFSNMSRDLMWAMGAVAVKENAKYNVVYHKNINKIFWSGTMPRLVHRHMMGTLNMNNELDRYFEEFVRHGGETGYTAINSIEHYKRNIKRSVKDAQGKRGMTKKAWNGVFDAIEFMNRSAENMTRFAVYVTSREMGRDQARAAHDAKEITVNFNKKGSGELGARYLGGLYVFMNACIQSMANFARLTGKHPVKMTGALATMAGLGFMLPLLNRMLAEAMGDDDEYWNLPEWVRRNNLVFRIPGTNKFITLPISHELRPFYGIGEIAYSVMNEKEDAKEGLGKAMLGFSGMSPIDFTGNGGNVAVNLTPTAFQPVAQLIANVDYFGKPIFKDADYLEDYPEYTKAYKGTSPMLVSGTEFLNRVSGGDAVVKGDADLNPDVIEHLVESYFGGAGKTVNKAIKGFSMIWDEDTREIRNIPIVNKFLQTAEERTSGSSVNKDYFEALQANAIDAHKVEGYGKQVERGNLEYKDKYDEAVTSPGYKAYKLANGYKEAISIIEKYLPEASEADAEMLKQSVLDFKKEMLDEISKVEGMSMPDVNAKVKTAKARAKMLSAESSIPMRIRGKVVGASKKLGVPIDSIMSIDDASIDSIMSNVDKDNE